MFRLYFCLVIMIILTGSRAENFKKETEENVHLCGKHLSNLLKTVCPRPNRGGNGKRAMEFDLSDPDSGYNDVQDWADYPAYPFRIRTQAFSFIPNKFRQSMQKKSNLVTTCCYNSCSRSELMSFCPYW